MKSNSSVLLFNNIKKYPFFISLLKNPPSNEDLYMEIASQFNHDDCSFFVFTDDYDYLISYRFVQFSQSKKVLIDCECGQCNENTPCYPIKSSLMEVEKIINDKNLFENFKDAEIVFNSLSKRKKEIYPVTHLFEAIDESNESLDVSPLLEFSFVESSKVKHKANIDWKILKNKVNEIQKNQNFVVESKNKDEVIYVLESHYSHYYDEYRTNLSIYHFKKSKDTIDIRTAKTIEKSLLKEAKYKVNESYEFKDEFDQQIFTQIRDILLNRKVLEARGALGVNYSDFPVTVEFKEIIKTIGKNNKLFTFLEEDEFNDKDKLLKVTFKEERNLTNKSEIQLVFNEEKKQFILSDKNSDDQENVEALKIPGFEIIKDQIVEVDDNKLDLIEVLKSEKKEISIDEFEIEYFIDFLNQNSFYPQISFVNYPLTLVDNENIKIECKVEVEDEFCALIPILKYDNVGIVLTDLRSEIIDIQNKFHLKRNLVLEEQLIIELSESLDYSYWGNQMEMPRAFELIKKLDEQNIPMFLKNKKLQVPKKFSFQTSTGIDWVDINGQVDFSDINSIDIIKLKSALNKGPVIEFKNGEVGLLPDLFLKKYKSLLDLGKNQKNGSIRLNKLHSAFLDHETLRDLHFNIDDSFENYLSSFDILNKSKMRMAKEVNKHFKGTLRKYQLEGLNWLETLSIKNQNGILADDMGLGKTVQVIAHLTNQFMQKKHYNVLIVVPKSLIFNWKNEFEKFSPEIHVKTVQTQNDLNIFSDFKNTSCVYVVTYHFLRSKINYFNELEFNYIVLDEAQNIKNEKAQLTQSVYSLKSNRKLALTGTPIENSLLDLASILEFLYPGSMTEALKAKLDQRGPRKKDSNDESYKDDPKFLALFSSFINPLILRRTKKQVLTDLPPKIEKKIYLEFNDFELENYNTLKKAIQFSLKEDTDQKNFSFKMLEGILRLRQSCLDPALIKKSSFKDSKMRSSKVQALFELLEDIRSEGSKAIIFSQFSTFLEILKNEFDKEKLKYSYIDGQTKDREGEVRKFKSDKDNSVMLSTLKTGGVGLNLTEAEYVFIMDPWWNPAAENQAIDRAHRIGQSKTVIIYKLIMKNSIEEKVLELQELKREVADSVLEYGEEGLFKTLNKREISSLFL